jgi:hypothetical protein
MQARQVEIVVTNNTVGTYEARSYPEDQTDDADTFPLYRVPVYKIHVSGKDATQKKVVHEFAAPRFMPYYNPGRKHPEYTSEGWLSCGLSDPRRVVVSQYIHDYEVRNRYSPGRGAIVVTGSFYIHAGPASQQDTGFGSAGCIEIIGNYDNFKSAIAQIGGLPATRGELDRSIRKLVEQAKLIVTIQAAKAPQLDRNHFTRRKRWPAS